VALLGGALLDQVWCHQASSDSDLARAVLARPRDSRLQNAYGIALQQQGRLEESVMYFRKALELNPKYMDAANNLALALLTANRPGEALEALEKYSFATADYYALKGTTLNLLGRPVDAIPALRRAYELAPTNPDFAYDLIVVLLKAERSDEAGRVLAQARRQFPNSAKIHAASGMHAYLKGSNAEAAREYEAATKLEPAAADLWAALGDVDAATDRFAKAESAYSRSIELDPKSSEYLVKAGRNLLKLQRTAEAESYFRKALVIDAQDAEAQFELGKLVAARGDDPSAITHFERALAAKPSLNAAWYQLSLSYRRNGQETKSREAMERFRKTQ
jgi:tetratricopeptide (TPR) repeat protein